MKYNLRFAKSRNTALIALTLLLATATSTPVLAHGGKEHAAAFTAVKALEKATGLYNRLLQAKKLDESWETGLENVSISAPQNPGKKEYVVVFRRARGNPQSVFFFFTPAGKYAGSNFTGP